MLRPQSQSSHAGESPGVAPSFPGSKSGLQKHPYLPQRFLLQPPLPWTDPLHVAKRCRQWLRIDLHFTWTEKNHPGLLLLPSATISLPPLPTSKHQWSHDVPKLPAPRARPSPAFTFHWMDTNRIWLLVTVGMRFLFLAGWWPKATLSSYRPPTHRLSHSKAVYFSFQAGRKASLWCSISDAPPTFCKRAHLIRSDLPR